MFLWFVTYILIPGYTILFVKGNNWLTTNFSVIGNQIGKREAFVLWGLLVGIYFFWSLQKIVAKMPAKPCGIWLIPLALALLSCAVITPYLPDILPLKSLLHILFAFLASVCLMASLWLIVWKLYRYNKEKYRLYLAGIAGIGIFSLFLLSLAGIISSALEIFFTIASVLIVRRLYQSLV